MSDGQGGFDTATVTVNINTNTTAALDVGESVYRFLNKQTGSHLYTNSEVEASAIRTDPNLTHFKLEGPSFTSADPAKGDVSGVFRFFNTVTGAHLFTISEVERDAVIRNHPEFRQEPDAYLAYPQQVPDSIPLYRFFNTDNSTHFYTPDEVEKNSILNNLPNFNFEGVAYYVDRGDPNFVMEAPDEPLLTTIGRAPTIQEEVELGAL